MKRKKQIYFQIFVLLSSLSLILYSCLDDDMNLLGAEDADDVARLQEIREARAFFENYVANIPMDLNPQGMYPGNFATDWDNATYIVNTDDSIISLNVCIVPEYYYEGDFAKDYTKTPETDDDWYHTAISQKIVSLKNMRTGTRCCYIITLIPDANNATKSRAKIDWMFNNGDSEGNQFHGLAIFSTIESNAAMVVDRYGQSFTRASVFGGDNLSDMLVLMGAYKLSQKKVVRTKYYGGSGTEEDPYDGGWLSEFTVTAPYPTKYEDPNSASTTNSNPSDRGQSAMNANYSQPSGNSGGSGGGSSSSNQTSSTSTATKAATKAKTYPKNDKRKYGASSPNVDCSMFAQEVAKDAGIDIGRSTTVQMEWFKKNGIYITKLSDLKVGDFAYWTGHTGIIVQTDPEVKVVHATINNYKEGSIKEDKVTEDGTIKYWSKPFIGAGRFK